MAGHMHLRTNALIAVGIGLVLGLVASIATGCVRSDLAEAFGHEAPPPQAPEPAQPAQAQPDPSPAPAAAQPAKPAPKAGSLVVSESRILTEQGVRYVVGTVKNGTRETYRYVQVEINLYDKSGALVNTLAKNSVASGQSLAPGSSWQFKAVIMDQRVTSYRIKSVKGFTQ